MFQRILVAVAQSAIGELTFKAGVDLAKTMNARMMLVHVIEPTAPSYLNPVFPMPDTMFDSGDYVMTMDEYKQAWDVTEEAASSLLQSLQNQANVDGVSTEVSRPLGDPAYTICQIAKSWNADLIVVGRHHRSRVGELFWGSVSNFVMHHADCFVLVAQETPENAE